MRETKMKEIWYQGYESRESAVEWIGKEVGLTCMRHG